LIPFDNETIDNETIRKNATSLVTIGNGKNNEFFPMSLIFKKEKTCAGKILHFSAQTLKMSAYIIFYLFKRIFKFCLMLICMFVAIVLIAIFVLIHRNFTGGFSAIAIDENPADVCRHYKIFKYY